MNLCRQGHTILVRHTIFSVFSLIEEKCKRHVKRADCTFINIKMDKFMTDTNTFIKLVFEVLDKFHFMDSG